MLVIVCSCTPGERLNLGPLDGRLISWVLRLCVRSVTSFASFTVFGKWVLLVSPLLSRLEAVYIGLASFDVFGGVRIACVPVDVTVGSCVYG